MIYKPQIKIPHIHFVNDDYRNHMPMVKTMDKVVVVTDPPFNIGYYYSSYKDKIDEAEYFSMLSEIINTFPSVIIHYPEPLHKLSVVADRVPEKVVSWVYNSNTPKQHRDIAFYGVCPSFKNAWQPYKNPNDKRIRERLKNGSKGGRMYDWWNVNQVKNVSKEKSNHPCQMPVEVMKNIVSTLPSDSLVFDPFMGSGTTAIACIDLGYDFIGCEIDGSYYDIAKRRIGAKIDGTDERFGQQTI